MIIPPNDMTPIDQALDHIPLKRHDIIARHLIASCDTLLDGLKKLNLLSGRNMTLFVLDEEGKLRGSLTDGDLRRALVAGKALSDKLEDVCNINCMRVEDETSDDFLGAIRGSASRFIQVAAAREKGVALLPVINNGYIVDLLDLHKLKASLPLNAVLMAGGRGERLKPLTDKTPKPLLPVGGQPIIDYNINELLANGIQKIYITVNYLKEQIVEHIETCFSNDETYNISCVEEPKRLGTIGSLALIDNLDERDILLMNSDLLTSIDFQRMYRKHISSGAALTMAVVPYSVSVPFAIIEHEGDRIKGLSEKPTYNYFANAGIYMMKRSVVNLIKRGVYMDATDFVRILLEKGQKVVYFPVDGTWIDIGSPDDYRAARELTGMSLRTSITNE